MKTFFVLLTLCVSCFLLPSVSIVAQKPIKPIVKPLTEVVSTPKIGAPVPNYQDVLEPESDAKVDAEVVTSTGTLPLRDQLDAKTLFDALYEPLFGAIFILLSYLSYFIPGLNRLQDTLARVVAIGCILGIGFMLFGVSFWKVATTFLISSGAYTWFFKAIFKTPKPALQG